MRMLVLLGGLFYLGVAGPVWRTLHRLLPPVRVRPAPWNALAVLVLFALVVLVIPFVCWQLLVSTDLGEALYGTDVMARTADASEKGQLDRARVGLFAQLLALPLQLVAVPAFLKLTTGTQLYQLGITTHRLGSNVALGGLGWVLLAPPVLVLFYLASQLYLLLSPDGVGRHAIDRLRLETNLTSMEYGLIVLVTMVAAPLLEELLFRGVLLGWLGQSREGSHAVVGLCGLWAVAYVGTEHLDSLRWGAWNERLLALLPVLFVLALLPIYVAVCRRQRTPVPTAVFASSLLFALVHSAWPAPLALFALALGLGWLARRTQSLVGPVVLHSLFNGIACVQLLSPS